MAELILIGIGLFGCLIISIGDRCKYHSERDKCESMLEVKLYDALCKEGYKPRTQYKCGYYRIDIALPEYRLAIECDGEYWHSSPEAKKRDAKKNYYLKKNGWKVCRLKGKTINKRMSWVIEHIESRLYE